MTEDNSTSGFINPKEVDINTNFTEQTIIPSKGYNLIVLAKRNDRWWILKGLKTEYRGQSVYQALLHKEFGILIGMQHPNIAGAFSFENVEDIGDCIVMEWVDGVTLKEWLKDKHSRKERLRIANQLIDTLTYIHSCQVAHRDLKPSNIMITRNGQNVKLIDFGLSDTDSHAILKQPAGTKNYISQEQATNRKTDIRNDIYSLGCILEDLKLGWRYHGVIKRCKAPIEKRYKHAEDVKKSIRRRSYLPKIIIVIVAIIAVFALMVMALHNMKPKTERTYHINQIKQIVADTVKKHDNSSLQVRLKKLEDLKDKETAVKDKENKDTLLKNQALAKGKKLIDKEISKFGMDAKLDTLTSVKYIENDYVKIIKKMDEITTNYSQSLPSTINDQERFEINNLLKLYLNNKYYFPWSDRMK